MITGVRWIRDAYRDETVARTYVGNRFREPLGALLHARQVSALRRIVERQRPRRTLESRAGAGAADRRGSRGMGAGRGIAVEASAQMLAEARRVLGEAGAERWQCLQGDAFNLPLRPGFNLVYVFRLHPGISSGRSAPPSTRRSAACSRRADCWSSTRSTRRPRRRSGRGRRRSFSTTTR